jgi:hypothetical protein
MPGSATDGRYNSCDLASTNVEAAYRRRDRNLTGLVVVVVTCAVLLLMAGAGVGLIFFSRDVPVVRRAGPIGGVERTSANASPGNYQLCLGAPTGCELFRLYRIDFRPRLPDLFQLRGSVVELWIVEGTRDVLAAEIGGTLYTTFAFRHPGSRTWLLRLWGAGLVFFPTLVFGIFAWAKTVGPGRARQRQSIAVDDVPRRGGGYLVALVTAFVLVGYGLRVFGTLPLGSGQIASAYPPTVFLCWTWPVLVQNFLEWLGNRSAIPYVVERAEWLATYGGFVALFAFMVLPFEILIAWDGGS